MSVWPDFSILVVALAGVELSPPYSLLKRAREGD